MIKHTRWLRSIGVVVVSMLLLAGCRNASGGGWIPSATGEDKATFGFTFHCKDKGGDAHLSGQLQYQDKPYGIRLHGTMGGTIEEMTCTEAASDFEVALNESSFDGQYRPQPKGQSGTFFVNVVDNGEPGKLDDEFCIVLLEGAYDGYQNCRTLGAGNIQVRASK
mgnify:CR=1 FL=1